MTPSEKSSSPLKNIIFLLKELPAFSDLNEELLMEFALYLKEKIFRKGQIIVKEGDQANCLYLIVSGLAEVTKTGIGRKVELLSTLGAGDMIGLGEEILRPASWVRTATVIAQTKMRVFFIDVNDYNKILEKFNEVSSTINKIKESVLLHNFIKAVTPFEHLNHQQIRELIQCLIPMHVKENTRIIEQNKEGNECYFIRKGEVSIVHEDKNGFAKVITTLQEGNIFGETALLAKTTRSASVISTTECELLVLHRDDLQIILNKHYDVARGLLLLQRKRSKPKQVANVEVSHYLNNENEQITVLKNLDNNTYFQLTYSEWFIWQQLDGQHTIQDIAINLYEKLNIFNPELVISCIVSLIQEKFAIAPTINIPYAQRKIPLGRKILLSLRNIFEIKIASQHANEFLTTLYQKYIHWLFTWFAQIALALFAVSGFLIFLFGTPLLAKTFYLPVFILLYIPGFFLLILLHEAGHAFTTISFGRKVNNWGIGWMWIAPFVFVDTTDMWLCHRWKRIAVNLAGIYTGIICASLYTWLGYLLPFPSISATLWVLAMIGYISAFGVINPLFETDGYYTLSDLLNKPNLRLHSIRWAVKILPKIGRRKTSVFRGHLAESVYWGLCIIYLVAIWFVTYSVSGIIFPSKIHHNMGHYIAFGFIFVFFILSIASLLAEAGEAELIK